jgi:beta-lactamase class A
MFAPRMELEFVILDRDSVMSQVGDNPGAMIYAPPMNRRDVLCSTLALLASPALAQSTPLPALTDYERDSGGHIGVYAKNLRTGSEITWRAHERFVMCSSFKASLAACVLAKVDRGEARLDELIAYGPANLMEWAPVATQNVKKGVMSVAGAAPI